MLNRRHLRVKVLQSLYAYLQSGNNDLVSGQNELMHGIGQIYELFLYQLQLIGELHFQAIRQAEDNRSKKLPTEEDLHPNTRFIDNACLVRIAGSASLRKKCKDHSVIWANDQDLVRKLLANIQQQKYYHDYLETSAGDFQDGVAFVIKMIKKDLMHFELLHHFYEEKSIYWLDDWELVNKMLIKMLMHLEEEASDLVLPELFNEDEDREFAISLFSLTILNQKEMDAMIAARTENWDIERIALMDTIIMKMAITEILKFPMIPVKVSLNEYIELSKMYSTPKSKVFVNGVLDKLVEEFIQEKKILKP